MVHFTVNVLDINKSLNSVRNWHKILLLCQPMKICHIVIWLIFMFHLSPLTDPLIIFFFFFRFSLSLFPLLILSSCLFFFFFHFHTIKSIVFLLLCTHFHCTDPYINIVAVGIKAVFGSRKSISGKYSIFRKYYFPERKTFSCVWLSQNSFYGKLILVFGSFKHFYRKCIKFGKRNKT